jgi:hypothetical protein
MARAAGQYHRLMPRVRLDIATTVLAISGVVAALALVGIFIVYLTDNRDSPISNTSATTAAQGTTGTTAQQPGGSTSTAKAPAAKTPAGKTTTGTAPAGTAPVGKTPSDQIPANQALVTYRNRSGGYSFKYPQGWSSQPLKIPNAVGFGSGANSVHAYFYKGPPATVANVVKTLKSNASLKVGPGAQVTLNGAPVVKTFYTVPTAGDAEITFRYAFSDAGKRVDMDLASPKAVNKDVYKRIARSFRWL